MKTIDRINAFADRKHMDEDERQDLLREIAMDIADHYFYTQVWTRGTGLEGFEQFSEALECVVEKGGGAEQFIEGVTSGRFFHAEFEGTLKGDISYSDGTVRNEEVASVSIEELRFSEGDKEVPDICDIWGLQEDRDELYDRLYETVELVEFVPTREDEVADIIDRRIALEA
jgi:hypothetical protein